MQAVGRIGSYITKSVYTVSGPFHPFGGAVDIIVVEQPDGSYKSSPWYVRFGKFQGVLKSKEKIVNISVNDVDADFHMYLDHKGEAFFLSEVDEEGTESAFSPPSSSGEDMEGQPGNRWSLKSKSCNFDSNMSASVGDERKALTRANSRRSQFLGLVFGRRSASEEDLLKKENSSGVVLSESLELAEFTADLFDLKWSTNLDSPKTKGKVINGSLLPAPNSSKDEKIHVDGCSHDENDDGTKCLTSEYVVKTTTTVESFREDVTLPNSELVVSDNGKSDIHVSSVSFVSEVAEPDRRIQESIERLNVVPEIQQCLGKEDQFSFVHEEKTSVSGGTEESIVTECYSQLVCLHKSNGSLMNGSHMEDQNVLGEKEKHETSEGHLCNSVKVCTESQPKEELLVFGSHMEDQNVLGETDKHETSEGHLCNSVPVCTESQPKEELLVFGDLDDLDSTDAKHNHSDNEGKEADSVFPSCVPDESSDSQCFSLENSIINDYLIGDGVERTRLCTAASDACINENGDDNYKGLTRMARSLPSIGPLSGNLEASDLSQSSYPLMYPGVSSDSNKKHRSPGDRTSAEDIAILEDSKEEPAKPSLGSEGNWSAPLRRSRGRKVSHADVNGCENPNGTESLNNSNYSEKGTDVKVIKKTVRTLTPTSEQLASLNLKEGKNVVVFTFSTSMLGNQQVDARIFLWRWDTRIVISDVDGTITRSDLLGQVMPLVGMDWSQTGVAHLFSAIKENGYQLLFLSARSISQSFITRQFLFSIKQDGKALPDGPVVISPDGLFPSLFREVVRRAPHEFKIACLEDIKALFPPDQNPFYAGFGNRDTDEFSYLKVGIPRGKIFIINPKGEIAVNRRVDTKNYLALHALVHGMFPTMSTTTCEQEDFNSWNYWKLPPPMMDL